MPRVLRHRDFDRKANSSNYLRNVLNGNGGAATIQLRRKEWIGGSFRPAERGWGCQFPHGWRVHLARGIELAAWTVWLWEKPLSLHFEHSLPNGLKLLVEPMSGVRSVAFTLLVPGGVSHEPVEAYGVANLVSSMTPRGAGAYDSRELTRRQDSLGVQHGESAEISHSSFTAATIADSFEAALELTMEMVRRPRLPADELDLCKAGILQEIQAIEDDPGQKLFVAMRRAVLPDPLGRPILGTASSVESLGIESLVEFHRKHHEPSQAILGVAGAVDFARVRSAVERLFSDWAPAGKVDPVHLKPARLPAREHIASDKVQTHVGLAFESVRYADEDFFNANGAVGVLSGGMSSRLWTEVREKRGLCYSVGASYVPLKELGVVLAHTATTTSERATEALGVILREIERLRLGIGDDELARVKAGLKSSLVMAQESTSARAASLARGWYQLGRVRTVEEIGREIDRLTPASILGYLERHPMREIGILSLGNEQVEIPG